MSLIRQIWALLAGVLALAIGGAVCVNLLSAREVLQSQVRLKNSDNAHALALVLSQQHGDAALMGLAVAAQFDTGYYHRIRFIAADGRVAIDRESATSPGRAPAWFAEMLPIRSEAGVAQVSDGWRPLGRLEVESHIAYAYEELWQAGLRTVGLMAVIGVAAAGLAALVVGRIRRPLDATVDQARSLQEGRYVLVDEPAMPEMRRVAAAMNGMVRRVRGLFEAQAAQSELLRRQAHCDELTGLPHRTHFMALLTALLQREDGADGGGLVLVRLADLNGLNVSIGRAAADDALKAIAQVLKAYPERVGDCFVGRLNGADFALCLPTAGLAAETAESVSAALRSALPAFGPVVQVHIGAVEVARDAAPGALLAQADLALARSEARGPFAVEVLDDAMAADAGPGEHGWREQIVAALEGGRARLVAFPLIDHDAQLVHLECPLRLALRDGAPPEPAARWLPLAIRNRLTGSADRHAVALALEEIARDGQPRAVNIAPASLADLGFAAAVRHLLQERPQAARGLWIEVPEVAALDAFGLVQAFGRLVRPLGTRFGLEHAGARLHRIERLYELGLDYVKLDASVGTGVARSASAQDFLRSTVSLLHALSVQVHAEGVSDADDVAAMWACGIDAVTGPWASVRWTG